jgi:hypothetical protein
MWLVSGTAAGLIAALSLWWLPRAIARVIAAAAVIAACTVGSLWIEPAPVVASDARPLVQPDDGYIGSAACRSCHPGEHATWHDSFHRTMTQLARRENVVAQFERLDLDWFGAPVRFEWRGERLWTQFQRRGRQPAAVERPIEQITGSHHLQVFWYSTGRGRELAPVPLCYKLAERIWLPLTAVFVLPPDVRDPPEPGAWSESCSSCHATHTEPRIDIGKNDTQVAELGIACEACHGPARAHVAANQEPLRRYAARYTGADATVTNPATLKPVHSAQACGHCHAVSILRQQHFDAWREHGSPFRPGQDLHQSHLLIDRREADAPELARELRQNPNFFASAFWSDGQVRLSGREFSGLRRSPCYVHGDAARQLDCTSCHELHPDEGATAVWRAGQMRADARGNGACTQCHPALAAPSALAAHTHHAADSIGSSCYACHMPHTSVGLMKASRSHEITSPDVAVELATGRPNACNLCHLDRSLGWTTAQLQANWGIAAPALTAEADDVAAGVRWLLTGDAGLRLLTAVAAGDAAAQRTAATAWLPPFLGRLLDDPYYVVRFAAARSLRSLAGYGPLLVDYPFLAEREALAPFVRRVDAHWSSTALTLPQRSELLLGRDGLDRVGFERLYARRDDRRIYLAE